MRHILVYSDSLAWGIVSNTRRRLPFDERWPGVLENRPHDLGQRVRVIEDCLNGRRTVWEDPPEWLRGLERDGVARCSIPKRHGLTSAFDPELLDDEGFVESGKPLRVV